MTPRQVQQAIAAAREERDAGMALAETGDQADWDKKLIDQAIAAFAKSGERFSANDLRELLPEVRTSLMGSRFFAAATNEVIRKVGRVTSTKSNTHNKDIDLWVGVTA